MPLARLWQDQEEASQREAELMHQVAELEDQVETLMEQGESSNNGLQAMLNRFKAGR